MHRLESEQIVLTVLPERGAKIAQLHFKPLGVELLWQPTGDDAVGDLAPGITYGATHSWGWDEMFPSIKPGVFDANGRHLTVPDHGEVWSVPWRVVDTNGVNTITLSVAIPWNGYELTRKTTVTEATVRHDYTLKNTGTLELPWIWAAHPLFVLKDRAVFHVPAKWDLVRNAYDSPSMPDYNTLYPYPGTKPHLGELPAPDSGVAEKYYFEYPNTNPDDAVVLSQPSLGIDIRVHADPRVAPWYGIWCNAGGLFGQNNVAIEPASAPMDSLSAASRLGRLPYLPAGERVSWWMIVSIGPNQA